MPTNRKKKTHARMDKTGESYAQALRQVRKDDEKTAETTEPVVGSQAPFHVLSPPADREHRRYKRMATMIDDIRASIATTGEKIEVEIDPEDRLFGFSSRFHIWDITLAAIMDLRPQGGERLDPRNLAYEWFLRQHRDTTKPFAERHHMAAVLNAGKDPLDEPYDGGPMFEGMPTTTLRQLFNVDKGPLPPEIFPRFIGDFQESRKVSLVNDRLVPGETTQRMTVQFPNGKKYQVQVPAEMAAEYLELNDPSKLPAADVTAFNEIVGAAKIDPDYRLFSIAGPPRQHRIYKHLSNMIDDVRAFIATGGAVTARISPKDRTLGFIAPSCLWEIPLTRLKDYPPTSEGTDPGLGVRRQHAYMAYLKKKQGSGQPLLGWESLADSLNQGIDPIEGTYETPPSNEGELQTEQMSDSEKRSSDDDKNYQKGSLPIDPLLKMMIDEEVREALRRKTPLKTTNPRCLGRAPMTTDMLLSLIQADDRVVTRIYVGREVGLDILKFGRNSYFDACSMLKLRRQGLLGHFNSVEIVQLPSEKLDTNALMPIYDTGETPKPPEGVDVSTWQYDLEIDPTWAPPMESTFYVVR